MPSCDNCGSHVSDDFARVFCEDGQQPQACPACVPSRRIFQGAAVDRSRGYEERSNKRRGVVTVDE